MPKEENFTELVLAQVKSHVLEVTSLEHIITNLDSDMIAFRLKKHLNAQVNENIRKLKEIRKYEAGIDEGLLKRLCQNIGFNLDVC